MLFLVLLETPLHRMTVGIYFFNQSFILYFSVPRLGILGRLYTGKGKLYGDKRKISSL